MIPVTIVGAGHYARSIVAQKYAEDPGCSLRAVISPTAPVSNLVGTRLEGLPLVRTAEEWCRLHGPPGERDLFDLCVHPAAILPAMQPLVKHGARAFVLPKPLATTRAGLDDIVSFAQAAGLWVAVASQWHYSRVTAALRDAAAMLPGPLRVSAEFSQLFSQEQLRHYTPYSALLPHMLQIVHTTGLWPPDPRDRIAVEIKGASALHVRIESAATGNLIDLRTDLKSGKKVRLVSVADSRGSRVNADFLGIFHDGVVDKYPAVEIEGHRSEIIEDNIAVMVRREIAGLTDGASCLDIDSYLPVNDILVAIVQAGGES